MLCPYCKKGEFIPDVVFRHTEAYGSGYKNFKCIHCGKVVNARCSLKVIISKATQTDNESDWS